jgi:hypothetical protein
MELRYSRKHSQHFWGCTKYPKCKGMASANGYEEHVHTDEYLQDVVPSSEGNELRHDERDTKMWKLQERLRKLELQQAFKEQQESRKPVKPTQNIIINAPRVTTETVDASSYAANTPTRGTRRKFQHKPKWWIKPKSKMGRVLHKVER